MSTRARCRNAQCPKPYEGDVPEFGPPLPCPGCGRDLEPLTDDHPIYPPTRFPESNDPWPTDRPFPVDPPSGSRNSWRPTNGSVFADRYYIIRKIAQGGMGAVYEAHDSRFDRIVALKIPDLARAGTDVRERFIREAKAMAYLMSNSNICTVIDVGDPKNEVLYLTMEFIVGKPLSALIQEQYPVEEAVRIVQVLATALAFAHSKGIIHRDLKPDNVMVRDDGTPVLMDFGLVRRETDERITVANTLMGTLPYMSPEQAKGDTGAIGTSSDIYGLGVIFYELLTGHRPFKGRSEIIILNQIINMNAEPPSTLRPDLDPQLESICMKAIAKLPGDRHASMSEMAQRLTEYSTKPIDKDKSKGKPKRQVEVKGSPRVGLKIAAAIVGFGIIIGGLIVTFWLRPVEAPDPIRKVIQANSDKPPDSKGAVPPAGIERPPLSKDVKSTNESKPDTNTSVIQAPPSGAPLTAGASIETVSVPPAESVPNVAAPAVSPKMVPREIQSPSTGMVLVFVAPGRFRMGSTRSLDQETPVHDVEIRRPFLMGKYEVTQAQYLKVMATNPSHFQGDDHLPVESVTWLDAVRFCNRLSVLDGLAPFYTISLDGQNVGAKDWGGPGYRLPTEAEWEFACRGGRTEEFGSREDDSDLPKIGWFRSNSQVDGLFRTHPEPPEPGFGHPWDLRNLSGNVWEWCWDRYQKYAPNGVEIDPIGPLEGEKRVVRGGSYSSQATQLRPSARHSENASNSLQGTGFRVARNSR